VLRLGERGDVRQIHGSAGGALHPDEVVAPGDRDRVLAGHDHERALAKLGERRGAGRIVQHQFAELRLC
jgi:hypothetical protein